MEKPAELKESSKRSWPWRKKSNDKISAAPELGTSPNSSKFFDEQQRWDYHHQELSLHAPPQPSPPKEQARNSHDRHDRNRGSAAMDEARSQWQQSEDRARLLNEKLATALADITTKDNLVKQHVKVAEEAVTGWEKAEAEALALKSQLDVALQQKLATEDRVAHLDGALKECMKQLRHVREEQEQRIHDTLVKKTCEYDKLRMEMEAKLADASHASAQARAELLESRGEATALSHALQERGRSIAEISEAKGRAETDIKILQVRLETVEKENSQLKYEVHVLNKELEIRGQEREYERKAVDMASKQQLESVKKIAKLEEECNRLRLLVRKKLPGPAAIQRMRMEVDGTGKDPTEKRRRSLGRSVSSLDQAGAHDAVQENEAGGAHSREAQMLAERVVAMDEEMRMLKDALAQRNGELQSSRLMCAKTATQLSVVEDELHRCKQQQKGGSTPVNLANGAALVAELDPAKKGKTRSKSVSDGRRDSQNFELMDDFAEMERLAMSEASQEATSSPPPPSGRQQLRALEEALAARDRDLEAAHAAARDLRAKLAAAEQQLAALQARNATNEVSLIGLQDQLDLLNEARENGGGGRRLGGALRGLSGYTMKDILGRAKKGDGRAGSAVPSEGSSSEGEVLGEHTSVSDAESKASTAHSELAVAVRKIIHIVEALAQVTGGNSAPAGAGGADASPHEIALELEWKDLSLDRTMRNLALVSNKFLRGSCNVVDIMAELGAALESILALLKAPEKSGDGGRDELEKKLRADVDVEFERLRAEKAATEAQLEAANEWVESLKARLRDGKRFVAIAQPHQGGESPDTDGRKDDERLEEELMVLSSPNASGELTKLHDKVAALEVELRGERQRHQSVAGKLEDLQHQLQRGGHAVSSEMSGVSHGDLTSHSTSEEDEDTKSEKLSISDTMRHERQEREIAAAALAECQRTILALGKQLKGLGTAQAPREVPPAAEPVSLASSTDSATSIRKMTENMEFLRWQAEAADSKGVSPSAFAASAADAPHPPTHSRSPSAGLPHGHGSPWASPSPRRAHRSPSPGARRATSGSGVYPPSLHGEPGFYARGGGNGHGYGAEHGHGHEFPPRPPSPGPSDFSGQGPASVPGSPSRSPAAALRSLKTHASGTGMNGDAQMDEPPTEKPRNSSSFSRFYSRSRSGSMSGGSSG